MNYPFIGMPLSRDIIIYLISIQRIIEPGNYSNSDIRNLVISAHQQLGGIEYKGRTDIVTTFEGVFRKLQELNVMKKILLEDITLFYKGYYNGVNHFKF